jgi:hypothetical protein
MPGRPPKFESPDQLYEMFLEWKAEVTKEGNDEIPDVEGLCIYLDTARQTLFDYERKPEYSDTIKRIKDWIIYKKKQLAMRGKIPPAIYIFDAKNNAGYVDRTEQNLHVKELPKPLLGGTSVSTHHINEENPSTN